jgi:translation initiation factor 2A
MRASAVDLRWSPTGEALLALASTESDASNKSYYGDSKLHYLRSDGRNDCLVPLPTEGPVHDVAWSPRGDCFAVLAGFMPPRAVVFDSKCAPSLDLGSGPFCHARWSPHHGRFLCLAGFGNLAGDLAFFDRKADGKLKPCGSARAAGGVSLEWSPCARLLLVSTTAPRLRVDNGVRVFKYDGSLVASKAWEGVPAHFGMAVQPISLAYLMHYWYWAGCAARRVKELDKNFHIYIHGDRTKIEQGVDENGRKFYKIYYDQEA